MNKHYLLLTCLIITNCLFGQTTIFNSSSNTSGLAIDTNRDSLFIAAKFGDKIYTIDLDDTNYTPNILLSGVDGPEDIEYKDNILYISLNSNNSSLDKVIKIDITETNPSPIEITNSIPNPNGLTIYNNKLYVSSGENIYTLDLSIANPTPFLLIDDLSTVFGTVGLCVWNNYLYVTDTWDDQLVRYDLNTTNPSKEIIFNSFTGKGLTVKENKIYSTGSAVPTKIYEIDPINETYSILGESSIATGWDIVTDENSIFISNLEGGEVIMYNFDELSITELELLKTIIYPNPTNDYIQLKNSENIQNIELYDLNGKLAKKVKVQNNKFDIRNLKSGIYLLKSNEIFIGKIVKK